MLKTDQPEIIKVSNSTLPMQLKTFLREARWMLKDTYVVDGRHLVLVFLVDPASTMVGSQVPREVTKYVDSEDHAPYRAKHLKLATLRHFRECHREFEGTGDPMEGKSIVKSTYREFLNRHNVQSTLQGAEYVATKVTYKTEDTSLVYCTSRENDLASQYKQWGIASNISDVPRFAALLGAEFARQCDESRHTAITALDLIVGTAIANSEIDTVVHVYHGPVVYHANVGEILFKKIPGPARALSAYFLKGKAFEDQQEYRFVLTVPGGRPVQDEFFLNITPDLRSMFEKA
ncbi:MAG: hypothetical protein OXC05_15880 [Halieaceae bacterium]|nr:hypothetical protein [Halieaceae bacterium]